MRTCCPFQTWQPWVVEGALTCCGGTFAEEVHAAGCNGHGLGFRFHWEINLFEAGDAQMTSHVCRELETAWITQKET